MLWNDKINVAETHVSRTNYCKTRGYKVCNTAPADLTGKGGSVVTINESIKHYKDAKYETAKIQAATAEVQMKSKILPRRISTKRGYQCN